MPAFNLPGSLLSTQETSVPCPHTLGPPYPQTTLNKRVITVPFFLYLSWLNNTILIIHSMRTYQINFQIMKKNLKNRKNMVSIFKNYKIRVIRERT